eukprot:TRINITY_DN8295_c6_g1_i1.p2 TRINITY_DN8295_c6_g1~~TRINITY_DN8295_c6_g1_i1.p2  ORF type:complete len:100 (-),score=14.45 TRINITY_DN8295_c6_g1_i1:534-833(-)
MFLRINHFVVAVANLFLAPFKTPLRTFDIFGCLVASELCARGSTGGAALPRGCVCVALLVEIIFTSSSRCQVLNALRIAPAMPLPLFGTLDEPLASPAS